MATVTVSQQDGEITRTKPGDPPITYPVKNGKVDVPDDQLAEFLADIPGSSVGKQPATPAT